MARYKTEIWMFSFSKPFICFLLVTVPLLSLPFIFLLYVHHFITFFPPPPISFPLHFFSFTTPSSSHSSSTTLPYPSSLSGLSELSAEIGSISVSFETDTVRLPGVSAQQKIQTATWVPVWAKGQTTSVGLCDFSPCILWIFLLIGLHPIEYFLLGLG